MKKLLIAIILLIACPVWATTYYGGASGKNINADDLWFTAVDGSCAGTAGQGVNWATASANGNKLIANGCTVTIPNTSTQTLPASGTITISNKTDSGSNVVDGGGFTYATSADYAVTLMANIEAGATTGAALTVSGSASGNARFILGASGSVMTVTAGSATSIHGVSDTHTTGQTVYYANVTGGTNTYAYGLIQSGASGTLVLNGNATAASGEGYRVNNSGTGTINGNCVGSPTVKIGYGCNASGAALTVTGNIISDDAATGVAGKIIWTPAAVTNYITMDGGGTAVTVYYGESTRNTDPGEANVKSGTTYKILNADKTGSMAAGSGGGAWGF